SAWAAGCAQPARRTAASTARRWVVAIGVEGANPARDRQALSMAPGVAAAGSRGSVRLGIDLGAELLLALPHHLLVVVARARHPRGLGDLQLLFDDLLERVLGHLAVDV